MKKIKAKLLFTIIVISISFQLIWVSCDFAPGSYPYAEHYELNVSEEILIKSIQNFKIKYPQYNVPERVQLVDGRHREGYWYHFYFYYPIEGQIISTWLRLESKNKTTFALVSVGDGLILGNWKEINKDFSGSENKLQKKKFEERILYEVKKSL